VVVQERCFRRPGHAEQQKEIGDRIASEHARVKRHVRRHARKQRATCQRAADEEQAKAGARCHSWARERARLASDSRADATTRIQWHAADGSLRLSWTAADANFLQ